MKNFCKENTIILVRYPFTDLSNSKVRPALIIRDQIDNDVVCLPITSSFWINKNDIEIQSEDLIWFLFPIKSFIRVQKISTISSDLIIRQLWNFDVRFFKKIKNKLILFINW